MHGESGILDVGRWRPGPSWGWLLLDHHADPIVGTQISLVQAMVVGGGIVQYKRVVRMRAFGCGQERCVILVVVHNNVGCCNRLGRVRVLVDDRDAPCIERVVALALRAPTTSRHSR